MQKLAALGWNVITVWECEVRHKYKHDLTTLIDRAEAEILAQIPQKLSLLSVNRVGGTGLFPVPTSHTTVRTVRYTAVLYLR